MAFQILRASLEAKGFVRDGQKCSKPVSNAFVLMVDGWWMDGWMDGAMRIRVLFLIIILTILTVLYSTTKWMAPPSAYRPGLC